MPAVYRAHQTATKPASGTTFNVSRPAGAVVGDLLWMDITTDNATITTPFGWDLAVSHTAFATVKTYGLWRFYQSGDVTPVPVALSAAVRCGGGMVAFSQVHATPMDATPTVASGTTGAPNPPSITTATANALVCVSGSQDSTSVRFTAAPTGYAMRLSTGNQADAFGDATAATVTPGAVDPGDWTTTITTINWIAYTIALREGSAPAPRSDAPLPSYRHRRTHHVRR